MTLLFPSFGSTYRYYLKKIKGVVSKTPSAIILKLNFSNPKQAMIINFPNANKRV